MKHRNFVIVPALAAGLLALAGCGKPAEKTAALPPEVEIIRASVGDIRPAFVQIAEVKAYDEVQLVARVEGYLRKRHFEEGKYVKSGTLLYEIEPEIYLAKVKNAEAELEKAKAALKNAEVEYTRQSTLMSQDATSERARDTAKTSKLECEAKVKGAEAELKLAQQNLAYTKIYAPFDGWIGLSAQSEGNLVNLSTGALATVVKTDPIRVEFVLNELDLLQLLKVAGAGQKHKARLFTQDGAEYSRSGVISFWNNQINPSTGTLRLQARFDNPDRKLMPGMFVRLKLEANDPEKALLVPESVIMSDQAGEYVYVVGKDGTVARRAVTTGYNDEGRVAIEKGLAAGDAVIASGSQRVSPGAKVTIKESAAAPVKNSAPAVKSAGAAK